MNCKWATRGMSDQERLDFYTDKSGGPNACWSWKSAFSSGGYPVMRAGGRQRNAHRVALELKIGADLDANVYACHSCDNPSCVNPAHLFPGTPKQNSRDRDQKQRANTQRGERSGKAKLTEADVRRIRMSRLSNRVWARKMGVSHQSIQQVRSGQAWAHVE